MDEQDSEDPWSTGPEHGRAGRASADARFVVAFGVAAQVERERRGVSQEKPGLEAALDRTYVSGIERGVRNPTVVTIRRIEAALKVAPSRLLRAGEVG